MSARGSEIEKAVRDGGKKAGRKRVLQGYKYCAITVLSHPVTVRRLLLIT